MTTAQFAETFRIEADKSLSLYYSCLDDCTSLTVISILKVESIDCFTGNLIALKMWQGEHLDWTSILDFLNLLLTEFFSMDRAFS